MDGKVRYAQKLAKAHEAFHGEISRRGLQSGEPLPRVAEAKSAQVRDGKMQVTDGPPSKRPTRISTSGSLAGRSARCQRTFSLTRCNASPPTTRRRGRPDGGQLL